MCVCVSVCVSVCVCQCVYVCVCQCVRVSPCVCAKGENIEIKPVQPIIGFLYLV